MKDIFGREITEADARKLNKPRGTQPKGYAANPGTGPDRETCKTCKHIIRVQFAKTYLKCGLMRAHWTGGVGSDIRAKSPACRRWERDEE